MWSWAARLLVEARAPMIMTGSGAQGVVGPSTRIRNRRDQLRGRERRPQDLKALRVELRRQDADPLTLPPCRAMLLAKPTPTKSIRRMVGMVVVASRSMRRLDDSAPTSTRVPAFGRRSSPPPTR